MAPSRKPYTAIQGYKGGGARRGWGGLGRGEGEGEHSVEGGGGGSLEGHRSKLTRFTVVQGPQYALSTTAESLIGACNCKPPSMSEWHFDLHHPSKSTVVLLHTTIHK